jgi:hypothetical protein
MNKLILAGIALSLAAGVAAAQEVPAVDTASSGFGVSLKAGTAGFGVDLTQSLGDKFKLRAGYSTYEYSAELTEEDVDYDAELGLGGFNLLADYHPWAGGFRVTVGGYSPKHEIKGTARYTGPESTVNVNGRDYSTSELENLAMDAKWKGFRPYLGLGYDGFNSSKAGVYFTADAGIIFSGEPTIRLSAKCVDAAVCAQAAADIAAEENKLRGEIRGAKYLPVVQIGVGYRF